MLKLKFKNSDFKNLLTKPKMYEIVLIIIFLLLTFSNLPGVFDLSNYSNNILMYFSILVITVILFKCCNLLVGLFFIVAVIRLLNYNSSSNLFNNTIKNITTLDKVNIAPPENIDSNNKLNKNSIEVEAVNNIKKPTFNLGNKSYSPIMCNTHNASAI